MEFFEIKAFYPRGNSLYISELINTVGSLCICGRYIYNDPIDEVLAIVEGHSSDNDILFCGSFTRYIYISEKALNSFTTRNVTGYRNIPVKLFKRHYSKLNPVDGVYYALDIQGKIDLDYKEMKLKMKEACPICKTRVPHRGRIGKAYLDVHTWTGTDLCKLSEFERVFICTKQITEIIKEDGLKNFEIINSIDIFS